MRYPRRLLAEHEELLEQVRPHWRRLLPVLGWAMLLAALSGLAVAALDAPWSTVALGAAGVVWLVLSWRPLTRWWSTAYILTTERLLVRAGWPARTGVEVPLEGIRDVHSHQGLGARLLGYGHLEVTSAGGERTTRFEDVPDPETFQSLLWRACELHRLRRQVDRAHGVADALASLAALHERGQLTDDEFAAEKHRLLGGRPPQV